ncbi:hypothetical protein [Actinomadura oligospora]|nr:hypothetical protein [Actinomadura oligospora]
MASDAEAVGPKRTRRRRRAVLTLLALGALMMAFRAVRQQAG